jgi:hypothetical protein
LGGLAGQILKGLVPSSPSSGGGTGGYGGSYPSGGAIPGGIYG